MPFKKLLLFCIIFVSTSQSLMFFPALASLSDFEHDNHRSFLMIEINCVILLLDEFKRSSLFPAFEKNISFFNSHFFAISEQLIGLEDHLSHPYSEEGVIEFYQKSRRLLLYFEKFSTDYHGFTQIYRKSKIYNRIEYTEDLIFFSDELLSLLELLSKKIYEYQFNILNLTKKNEMIYEKILLRLNKHLTKNIIDTVDTILAQIALF